MTDVFLRSVPSDADSDDVRLRDPTSADAGGATEALSGEATLTLAATGDLTSVSALSGEATLTLTTTGSLLSTTALSGLASLTLAASGDLASVTGLSGISTLALAATGDLASTTPLSGSASLELAATGALASVTALSGEATLSLEASGDLTVTSASTGSSGVGRLSRATAQDATSPGELARRRAWVLSERRRIEELNAERDQLEQELKLKVAAAVKATDGKKRTKTPPQSVRISDNLTPVIVRDLAEALRPETKRAERLVAAMLAMGDELARLDGIIQQAEARLAAEQQAIEDFLDEEATMIALLAA